MTPPQVAEFPGTWRGLFDPFSAEWDWSNMFDKVACLKSMLQTMTFEELIQSYREAFSKSTKDYIFNDLPYAIGLLAAHIPQVNQYFHHNTLCTKSVWYDLVCARNKEFYNGNGFTIQVGGEASV